MDPSDERLDKVLNAASKVFESWPDWKQNEVRAELEGPEPKAEKETKEETKLG